MVKEMAKNIKKKIVRQVLGHPLKPNESTPLDDLTEEIHQLFSQTFSHVFPPNPSNEDLLMTLKIPKETNAKEKCQIIRQERKKLRSVPPKDISLKSNLSVGLKKCLRDLARGQIELVLFDPVALPDPVQTLLLTYDQIKVTSVKQLMKLTHETFGFSASMVGFRQLSGQSALTPWVELCQKLPKNSQLSSEIEGSSPSATLSEIDVQETEPMEESERIIEKASSYLLLKRTNSERVFKPTIVSKPKMENLSDFGSDFIGFEEKSKKRKTQYHKTNMIKMAHNEQK